jgi:hypothetical protein
VGWLEDGTNTFQTKTRELRFRDTDQASHLRHVSMLQNGEPCSFYTNGPGSFVMDGGAYCTVYYDEFHANADATSEEMRPRVLVSMDSNHVRGVLDVEVRNGTLVNVVSQGWISVYTAPSPTE